MKNFLRLQIVLYTAFMVLALAGNSHASIDDRIIAVVNDEVITQREYMEYMQSVYAQLKTEIRDPIQLQQIMQDMQQRGIHQLIEDRLILSQANQMELEVKDKPIDDRIEEIKAKYASEQEFLDALIVNGSTVTDLREKIIDQLKINFVVKHEVGSKIFVNPQEVTEFYTANKEKFKRPERVNTASILISYKDGRDAAVQKTERIVQLLNSGGDFAKIAQEFSEGPSIGVVAKGQLLEGIEDVVFNLREGDVSEPIETETGIFIFKLISKIPPTTAELKEVKEDIKNIIHQEKFKKRYKEWVEKLKKKAYVEIKG